MPRLEQSEIPGTEAPKIKEIETAAATFVERRDTRMKMQVKEAEAKKRLIEACDKHKGQLGQNAEGEYLYRFDEEVVVFSDRFNVKVRAASEENGEAD
jgi:hypothetical protein